MTGDKQADSVNWSDLVPYCESTSKDCHGLYTPLWEETRK